MIRQRSGRHEQGAFLAKLPGEERLDFVDHATESVNVCFGHLFGGQTCQLGSRFAWRQIQTVSIKGDARRWIHANLPEVQSRIIRHTGRLG